MIVRPIFARAQLRNGKNPEVQLEYPLTEIRINPNDWDMVKDFCHPLQQEWKWIRKDEIRVWVPDGIGDLHWVFPKLRGLKTGCGAKRLILFKQNPGEDRDYFRRAGRADEFVAMNPIVDECRPSLGSIGLPKCGYLVDCLGYDYLLDPTKPMERGVEYRDWLPEVPTQMDYQMAWPEPLQLKRRLPVVYFGDRYAEITWHGHWHDEVWARLTREMKKHFGVQPVAVGLKSDAEKAQGVARAGGDFRNMVGKTTLREVLALVRQAPLVVGSVSGLTIVSASLGVRTIILWPDERSLQPLPATYMRTWAPPHLERSYVARGYSTSVESICSLVRREPDEVLRGGGSSTVG